MRTNPKTDPIGYITVRVEQLRHELALAHDEETHLILAKSIYELEVVLDLLKRNNNTD